MKKVLIILLLLLMFIPTAVFATDSKNESGSQYGKLNVAYSYKKDLYYRFIFSDIMDSKDSSFQDLFSNSSIEWIKMSKLENGKLVNDTPLYIHWLVDSMTPISKLTLEVPGPLRNDEDAILDWYVAIDNSEVIGGKAGYGEANAAIIFERDLSQPIKEIRDSVQLRLYSEEIEGKKAGSYMGTLILNVFGEI